MVTDLKSKAWWSYIGEDLQELLKEAMLLLTKVENWEEKFHDYAFVVFPAAKAYEGFLKKLFLDLNFISQRQYSGKRFRVGKALNPALAKKYQDENVYDKLSHFCGSTDLPAMLWNTWRNSRNLLFHWFPEEKNAISYSEAQERTKMIIDSMDEAFTTCKIKQDEK